MQMQYAIIIPNQKLLAQGSFLLIAQNNVPAGIPKIKAPTNANPSMTAVSLSGN
jgi:hypothetical protein